MTKRDRRCGATFTTRCDKDLVKRVVEARRKLNTGETVTVIQPEIVSQPTNSGA